jgi:hypothetical protein
VQDRNGADQITLYPTSRCRKLEESPHRRLHAASRRHAAITPISNEEVLDAGTAEQTQVLNARPSRATRYCVEEATYRMHT